MLESTNDDAKIQGQRDKDVKKPMQGSSEGVGENLKTVEVTGVKAKVLINFALPNIKV